MATRNTGLKWIPTKSYASGIATELKPSRKLTKGEVEKMRTAISSYVKKTVPSVSKTERKAILGFYGKKLTLNDDDRAQWIDNDEGLYNWWRSSRMSKRAFIKENRKELTELIMNELNRPPRR